MQLDFTPRQALNVGRMQLGAIDDGERWSLMEQIGRRRRHRTSTFDRHLPSEKLSEGDVTPHPRVNP